MTPIAVLSIVAVILYMMIQSNSSNKRERPLFKSVFVGEIKYADYPKDDDTKEFDRAIKIITLAGRAPERLILSSIIARKEGFKVGRTYLINCSQKKSVWYVHEFDCSIIRELRDKDIEKERDRLGTPVLLDMFQLDKNG